MGLTVIKKLRYLRLCYFPCQEHTAGFPAYGAAANHPVPELKIVFRLKILLHQIFQSAVSGHCAFNDLLLGLLVKLPLGILHLRQLEKPVMAVIILILAACGRLLQGSVIPADIHPIFQEGKSILLFYIAIRQKHMLGIPVPHLQRLKVYPLFF